MTDVLLAFDVDGTLDTSAGPVPFAAVRALAQQGIPMAIVSPSPHWPGGLPAFTTANRADNLRAARSLAPTARLRLYVSDNGDNEAARQAGFALILPADFAAMLAG